MYTVILVIHVLLALAIVLFVLIQRSENDGFGLSGGGNSLFSSRATANFLTRTTAILATSFFITSLTMAVLISHRNSDSIVDRLAEEATLPAKAEKNAAPGKAKAKADKAEEATETAPSVPLAD